MGKDKGRKREYRAASRDVRSALSVAQPNDCVSILARRMYTQQVTPTEMLQCSLSDTRQVWPELCLFVDSFLPIPFTTNNNSIVAPPSSLVRHAFRYPEAPWLSRIVQQNAFSALLCQQLVRLARQDSDNGIQDHINNTTYLSAAEPTNILAHYAHDKKSVDSHLDDQLLE
ncbi:unnamed protein product [Peronospora effusa]|nr:unnamed protein product [Peronospora effusa]